jgi:hypothetical protein
MVSSTTKHVWYCTVSDTIKHISYSFFAITEFSQGHFYDFIFFILNVVLLTPFYPAGGPDVRGLQDSLRSRPAQPHVVGATLSWTQLLSTCKIFMSIVHPPAWCCFSDIAHVDFSWDRVFSDFRRRLNTRTPCTVR